MNSLMFDLPKDQSSIIKVFGVGGGGSNAVNHMFSQGIIGVNFVVCNTDAQALDMSLIPNKVQLGPELTQGLGAGSNPEVGMKACEESVEAIRDLLNKNTKMVFVTAGMGGGTGTGAAPVVARIAREMGILTVGIVTTPFSFEGKRKYQQAMEGIENLRKQVDTIIIISNDKIRDMFGNLTRTEAFNHANNILATAAKGISEIITVPGEINVDFADVKYVMSQGGTAIMGNATAEGKDRALAAIKGAISSPLLNDNEIRGARRILINITSGSNENQVTIDEITAINEYVQENAKDTDIIFGTCDDPSMGQKLSVTVIATGFEGARLEKYKEVSVKKVYTLSDKPLETVTMDQPAVEVTPVPVQEPKKPEVKELTVEEEQPVKEEPKEETSVVASTEEYTLFGMFETDQAETTEAQVVEFEVKKTDDEILEEMIAAEEQAMQDEVMPVAETEAEEAPVQMQEEVVEVVPEEAEVENATVAEELFEETVVQETSPVEEEKKEEEFEVSIRREYVDSNENQVVQAPQFEDRKRMLSNLSYKIQNKQNLSEFENEPAYKRKGVEVGKQDEQYSTNSEMSKFSVGDSHVDNMRPEIRKNNSFLHDIVD